MSFLTSLGLMSGTSMDGIDGAILVSDGESLQRFGPVHYRPYSEQEQALLRKAVQEAISLKDRTARPEALRKAEQMLTDAHCEVIAVLLEKARAESLAIESIGFHGQTVVHKPEDRLTIQIGAAQKIADRFHIPVVADFRAADVSAGGEGAPLVPIMHLALAKLAKLPLPVAIVNIGGVANVTIIDSNETLTAFDTGPGNALINDFIQKRCEASMDQDGKIALSGRANEKVLEKLLNDSYFLRLPPKSLDRNHFKYVLEFIEGMSTEDGAATLTAFTAASLAFSLQRTEKKLQKVIIAGGGARNPTLMAELKRRTNLDIVTADILGWDIDFIEAQAFAFLAVRSLRGLPLTFPGTTGVKKPMTGGVVFQPRSG